MPTRYPRFFTSALVSLLISIAAQLSAGNAQAKPPAQAADPDLISIASYRAWTQMNPKLVIVPISDAAQYG